ncbi:hypothetical protein NDU88_002110 [Pleurodeles waltl]|uniref:Uncharacterized protein n=1 Tax=Pleurodeles waltl TaxID=8319 RepID=A0AAV7P5W0_PLEWA|nr:hypothetical protein NDU88_002110 [Pleurodeles waltl]
MFNSGSMLSSVLVECIEVSVFPFVVCCRRVFIGGAPAPEKVADWWENHLAWVEEYEEWVDNLALWACYIDDIYIDWSGTRQAVQEFISEFL